MGSRFSCRNRDSVPDDHPTKFKVTNVDDEGLELSSGVMELTERELVLHLQQWDSVHWPYRCLRRCGYDSDLFCFESDHRCQKGQGLFRFKCSRAKELFNLLEDWMRRNNINVIKEPFIFNRNIHPRELDLPRGPLQPTGLGYTISSFSNGFPGCPGEGLRFSAPWRPSASSLRHPSLVEESTRALIASNEQSHTYVNMQTGEEDHRRSRHCLHPLPESRAPFPAQPRGPDQRDPQVFLQPGQKPTCTRATTRSHGAFPVSLANRRGSPRASESFDFHRPGPETPGKLNYIQVELKGWGTDRPKGPQNPTVSGATGPTPARSSDSYAVIDFKNTVALSNLRRALPRDDGTVRKTRHNSTDLPL